MTMKNVYSSLDQPRQAADGMYDTPAMKARNIVALGAEIQRQRRRQHHGYTEQDEQLDRMRGPATGLHAGVAISDSRDDQILKDRTQSLIDQRGTQPPQAAGVPADPARVAAAQAELDAAQGTGVAHPPVDRHSPEYQARLNEKRIRSNRSRILRGYGPLGVKTEDWQQMVKDPANAEQVGEHLGADHPTYKALRARADRQQHLRDMQAEEMRRRQDDARRRDEPSANLPDSPYTTNVRDREREHTERFDAWVQEINDTLGWKTSGLSKLGLDPDSDPLDARDFKGSYRELRKVLRERTLKAINAPIDDASAEQWKQRSDRTDDMIDAYEMTLQRMEASEQQQAELAELQRRHAAFKDLSHGQYNRWRGRGTGKNQIASNKTTREIITEILRRTDGTPDAVKTHVEVWFDALGLEIPIPKDEAQARKWFASNRPFIVMSPNADPPVQFFDGSPQ